MISHQSSSERMKDDSSTGFRQRFDKLNAAAQPASSGQAFIFQPSRVPLSGILFFVPRSAGKVRVMSAEVFRRWRRTTKCAGASFSTSLSFPSLTLRFAQGAVSDADMAHWESAWCAARCRSDCQSDLRHAPYVAVYHGNSQRAADILMNAEKRVKSDRLTVTNSGIP